MSPASMPTTISGRTAAAAVLVFLVSASAFAGPARPRALPLAGKSADKAPPGPLASLPPGVRLLRDVPYGEDSQQRMDVYLPPGAKDAPVILMVHGGAWRTGDKTSGRVERKVARWAPRGFVFISINYRLLPKADPLHQADDVSRALAAAQAHAAQWGADPAKFILMGHSAGAHLVAFLSVMPAKAYALGARPWLGSVLLDSAALDVVSVMQSRHLPLYDKAFGHSKDYWRSVSPAHHLTAAARPMFLVCSMRRKEDSCTTARRFAAQAESLHVRAKVLPQNLSHGEINKSLGLPGAYTEAVEQFMRALDKSVANALTKTR